MLKVLHGLNKLTSFTVGFALHLDFMFWSEGTMLCELKKGSEMLRNKMLSQNTSPLTVKFCSYIPLMTRNRYPELTVPDWRGVTV